MIKQSLQAWREEAKRRFGDNGAAWKFKCPSCGNVQCGHDFVDKCSVDASNGANMAYQECIGRHTKEAGCSWAAFGFLGTVGKGRLVITPNGDEVEVFDFADGESEANE
ncbi:hypothetical protein WJ0W_005786 [Paenibacillus melissococcoides]|uniref:Uncharacterized protein n=1 Tax=Paenibacillus melissococcoides TaxID=2912268 RepID=A0ABN8UBS9_9BACL|nr:MULTISPECIES: VVA0879 family protein [Paenibacillus]MEB9896779.1 VVA0879 family protein [Bacillus cereus]CAH8248602.1 hypothetical protein WJ0W_005786 [Paenibacillus melissococcoides]CAH8714279.1 hypothetical protein WDD9_003826 [Paenibacillus melissococcoides]CAH8719954.1 hypothetical protein HTL2_005781 [Paenibacillus melissococcoides]GIO79567.1 hypothetical protein J6TS7_31770 [Paenibacillus dendritiformis]